MPRNCSFSFAFASHTKNYLKCCKLIIIVNFPFPLVHRDPMDALMLEQHLRSAPLGIFPDPMMAAQLMPQSMDAALLEKARQHLQMWGRSPYAEMLLPQMYAQRPNLNAAALNLGLWQGQWSPQLTAAAGFLNNQAALQQAVAQQQQQQQQQQAAARSPPPATPNSSGSPSPSAMSEPHMRSKHFAPRFSPYPAPPTPSHTQTSPTSPIAIKPSQSPPIARRSPDN